MMRRLACFIALLTFAHLASAQQGPLSPEKALAALKVADGFQVELFAAEPMLINPTSIDVDHEGRVWVAEAVNYRRVNFGRPIIRPEGDRIVVLVDEKGEGKATKAVTFYQGKEIIAPIGICVAPYPDGKGQRVFVCQSPDILVFEDKDGDLKADGPPKKLLTGFGGFDHDHGVHGINIGPDGKLYFTVGDSGVKNLQSSDGKGRKWTTNTTDCQKGTVWRCDMDGTNLELIAHNFRNNYECCVDSFGEIWLSDNDDDGSQQTRICYVMPGGNYGYGPRGPGESHWHEEQPGIVHKVLRTGFGSPCGMTFYEGSLFEKKYRGAILHCDAGPREVRWFFRKPKGAGYELEKELLLTSSDNWFRPVDACVAPDGSIFVADWYDRGVGGHGMGDPTDGRIYRITPKGHKGYKVPEIDAGKISNDDRGAYSNTLTALSSPCIASRTFALEKLRATKNLSHMSVLFDAALRGGGDPNYPEITREVLKTRALWFGRDAYFAFVFNQPEKMAEGLKENKQPDDPTKLREAAFSLRLIAAKYPDLATLPEPIIKVFRDGSAQGSQPELRELLLALRNTKTEIAGPCIMALAKKYDGSDHFYRAALNIACGTDPKRRDAILADFDKHFPEWNDKVADLVWELRPKSVLPRLGKLLADDKLTAAQKARIIDILASNADLAAGTTLLDVLKSDASAEVKARAVASLKLFIPAKWKGLQNSKELSNAIRELMRDRQTQIAGLQLIAAASLVERVDSVIFLLGLFDTPTEKKLEAIRTLGKLRSQKSVDKLQTISQWPPSPTNSPLPVEAIKSLASLVTVQSKDDISTKALNALQWQVEQGQQPERQKAAVEALASTRPGAAWLLAIKEQGKFPQVLDSFTGRLLRNNAYHDLRNRALLAFPAPGKLDPKKLPPIPELARRSGDAARGKLIWNASLSGAAQCAKCHMVRGIGGQVGPDLSMIGKKGGRENILESILQPSKAIADQYIQHSVTTTAEVTIAGLLIADTPTKITLRDANGKDTTIAKADIVGEVRKLKISIMPEDIVAALTEDELTDLVAYLETLKVAALTPDALHVVGPFPAKDMLAALDLESGPEKAAFDPKAKFGALTWKTIRPDTKGYFNLAALHGNAANNSASYLYVEIESPVDQAGEVLLGSDDGSRLWLNGIEVFVNRETRAAVPAQNTIAVKLKKGTNTVLLKVANGNNPHGFYFSLMSAEELKLVQRK